MKNLERKIIIHVSFRLLSNHIIKYHITLPRWQPIQQGQPRRCEQHNTLLPALTRRRISISLLPLILRILIPIIQLLRHRPLRALSSLHIPTLNPPRLLRPNTNSLTKLQIPLPIPGLPTKTLLVIARHGVVVLVAPAALEHAPVVPAASRKREPGAQDVGEDVEGVEVAVVGEEGLQDFGEDCEEAGDEDEGEVD